MRQMQIMDTSGHLTTKWNPDDEAEVAAAREMFETLVKEKGYSAFRVETVEGKGARLKSFDPHAEKMILIPQLVGG